MKDVAYVPEVPHVAYVPVHQQTALASEYFQSYSVVGLLALVGVLFVAVAFGRAAAAARGPDAGEAPDVRVRGRPGR